MSQDGNYIPKGKSLMRSPPATQRSTDLMDVAESTSTTSQSATPQNVDRGPGKRMRSESEESDISVSKRFAEDVEEDEELPIPNDHAAGMEQLTRFGTLVGVIVKSKRTPSEKQGSQLMGEFEGLRAFVWKLLGENTLLKGKIVESNKVVKQLIEGGNGVTAAVKELEKSVREMKEKPPQVIERQGPKSFANVVASSLAGTSRMSRCETVLIYPKEGANKKSEETKAEICKKLNPRDAKLKVTRVNKIREGGVAIEVDSGQAQVIKDKLADSFVVKDPVRRKSKIKIYDVPISYKEDELLEVLIAQNLHHLDTDECKKHLKPLFKTGPRNDRVTQWVLEATGTAREELLKVGRIFLDWNSCRVVDFVVVTRCYRCQRFGHQAKDCKMRETCSHCADEGHSFGDCPKQEWNYKCANCIRAKLKSGHNVSANDCPIYIREVQRAKEKICNDG